MMEYNTFELFSFMIWGGLFLLLMREVFQSLKIVPQRYAMLVERLGKYHVTLKSGFHVLVPFIDRVSAHLDLKEMTVDVPPQECFTKDEIQVIVDGIIYLSVVDPVKAAYGVTDYRRGAMLLAQTTTRSIIGKITLDQTFEEREAISASVVDVLEETGREWGIKVHRYEIKNIKPPESVKNAMEKEVKADRERHAIVAKSEGDKQSRISKSLGYKSEMINNSEGEKQRRINEAEGRAAEIKALADATASSIEKIALALGENGGEESLRLTLTERYLRGLGDIAENKPEVILPLDLSNCKDVVSSLESFLTTQR